MKGTDIYRGRRTARTTLLRHGTLRCDVAPEPNHHGKWQDEAEPVQFDQPVAGRDLTAAPEAQHDHVERDGDASAFEYPPGGDDFHHVVKGVRGTLEVGVGGALPVQRHLAEVDRQGDCQPLDGQQGPQARRTQLRFVLLHVPP